MVALVKHFVASGDLILRSLGITAAVDINNHREMIFQKVVIPSSQFLRFLISNRRVLNGDLLDSFMQLLVKLLRISPYHLPTLEFIVASPIVMAFSRCFSIVESRLQLWTPLNNIVHLQSQWKKECREVVQSGKQTVPALDPEGFESSIEQTLMCNKDVRIETNSLESLHTHFCGLSSDAGNDVIAGAV
ncbi:hypothetical protein BLNAU_20694 [Blattamonas nauphoetae]|uniref:Uncharacterized protein n=1 Tax=Blattamonas nauphoetae TaxID=2049346 RepID=A0ABQ9WY50_9EUKA|nr:hypothetical protein BLNAU_20694 [Blattamonas nauphoetae]